MFIDAAWDSVLIGQTATVAYSWLSFFSEISSTTSSLSNKLLFHDLWGTKHAHVHNWTDCIKWYIPWFLLPCWSYLVNEEYYFLFYYLLALGNGVCRSKMSGIPLSSTPAICICRWTAYSHFSISPSLCTGYVGWRSLGLTDQTGL